MDILRQKWVFAEASERLLLVITMWIFRFNIHHIDFNGAKLQSIPVYKHFKISDTNKSL